MERPPESETSARRIGSFWPFGLAALGLLAVAFPWLALPAAFFSFLGVLALWRAEPGSAVPRAEPVSGFSKALVGLAVVGAGIGVLRFVISEAMPGIVRGGREAVQRRTVSRLRDVFVAEQAVRRAGWIDPDGDGTGSVALLSELCGGEPLRGQPARSQPVLDCGELVQTPLGPAARAGVYLYTICVPSGRGGWTAAEASAVDEEKAEQSFFAFAWPAPESGFDSSIYIDEREAILIGRETAPSCGAVRAAVDAGVFSAWRGKKPRAEPFGD